VGESIAKAASNVGSFTVALWFVALVGRRFMRRRGLDRRTLAPVALSAVAGGVAAGFWAISVTFTQAQSPDTILLAMHLVMLVIPLSFAVASVALRLEQLAIAGLVRTINEARSMPELQAALAHALGDEALRVFLVTADAGLQDVHGSPVEAPVAWPGRITLPVPGTEGAGRAVVDVDAGVLHHERLLRAALAASSLALDNARLHQHLEQSLRKVKEVQAYVTNVAVSERRRIERDLHDGAQQQLAALTLRLGVLKSQLPDVHAQALLDGARTELKDAIRELRRLTEGMYPANLVEDGLRGAVEQLLDRMPITTKLICPDQRWPLPTEATAYFVICEALANVAKHSGADSVQVEIGGTPEELELRVADDGRGGAEPGKGSGLKGLGERVNVAGGTLSIISPPATGTTLRVSIPAHQLGAVALP
jgi:signal transduction histidine kinase